MGWQTLFSFLLLNAASAAIHRNFNTRTKFHNKRENSADAIADEPLNSKRVYTVLVKKESNIVDEPKKNSEDTLDWKSNNNVPAIESHDLKQSEMIRANEVGIGLDSMTGDHGNNFRNPVRLLNKSKYRSLKHHGRKFKHRKPEQKKHVQIDRIPPNDPKMMSENTQSPLPQEQDMIKNTLSYLLLEQDLIENTQNPLPQEQDLIGYTETPLPQEQNLIENTQSPFPPKQDIPLSFIYGTPNVSRKIFEEEAIRLTPVQDQSVDLISVISNLRRMVGQLSRSKAASDSEQTDQLDFEPDETTPKVSEMKGKPSHLTLDEDQSSDFLVTRVTPSVIILGRTSQLAPDYDESSDSPLYEALYALRNRMVQEEMTSLPPAKDQSFGFHKTNGKIATSNLEERDKFFSQPSNKTVSRKAKKKAFSKKLTKISSLISEFHKARTRKISKYTRTDGKRNSTPEKVVKSEFSSVKTSKIRHVSPRSKNPKERTKKSLDRKKPVHVVKASTESNWIQEILEFFKENPEVLQQMTDQETTTQSYFPTHESIGALKEHTNKSCHKTQPKPTKKKTQKLITEKTQKLTTKKVKKPTSIKKQKLTTKKEQKPCTVKKQEPTPKKKLEKTTKKKLEPTTKKKLEPTTKKKLEKTTKKKLEPTLDMKIELSSEMEQEPNSEMEQESDFEMEQERDFEHEQEATTETEQETTSEIEQETTTEKEQETTTEKEQETTTESTTTDVPDMLDHALRNTSKDHLTDILKTIDELKEVLESERDEPRRHHVPLFGPSDYIMMGGMVIFTIWMSFIMGFVFLAFKKVQRVREICTQIQKSESSRGGG